MEYLNLKHITALHGEEIQEAINGVVQSGHYLQGPRIAQFEQEYAREMQTNHCVSCASGLDALRLIIMAWKELGLLHEGDEVIVPANTYIASILAVSECGLVPVLVEPNLNTFQIDEHLIEEKITSRTRALMIVHLYGYDAMNAHIADICRSLNLLLIEDYAQSHGLPRSSAQYDGEITSAQAHSFYPTKNLGALADAGAVTTNDPQLADTIRALGNYGSSKKYVFKYRGINSRMDEMNAAVLSVKLKYLHTDNARRREIAQRYICEMTNEKIILPPLGGVYHIFPILSPYRDELQAFLKERNIGTMIHYPIPPHRQECYKELNSMELPITELIHNYELSLPCNPAMTEDDVNKVIEAVCSF